MRIAVVGIVLALAALGVVAGVVNAAATGPVTVDLAKKFERNLSAYNLFTDNASQAPNHGLIAYDLNTPLFSDYSAKRRFIYVPPGSKASYDPDDVFSFPVGSVIVKTFSFLNDIRDPSKGERIVETRLLVHREDGWIGLPYLWEEDMSDAKIAVAGATVPVSWTHYDGSERSIDYIVPNMNQCKQCHEIGGTLQPIGPKARHMNRDFAYPDGTENQLTRMARLGCLEGLPEELASVDRAAVWDDPASGSLDARARAWLDINCAHCHNPDGPAHMSGLDLRTIQTEPARYGVLKAPIAAGRGSGGHKYGIQPGDPDTSILVHRIESNDPGVMMPTLPRRVVHEEGVALIRQWIAGMDSAD